MNPSTFTNLPASACTLSVAGSHGSDRITKNHYDAAGQLLRVQKAVGTPLVQDYVTYTYTANGQQKTVKDANGNLATYEYDGFDRLIAWRMPSAANGAISASCNIGTISEVNGITGPADARGASDDCEKYSYDRNGNRARLVKRDGTVLAYSYDALNRMTLKDVDATNQRPSLLPTHKRDVHYGYDLRGLQLYARFDSATGQGVTTSYDGFGRTRTTSLNMDGVTRTLTYTRNKSGNRSKFDWFDGSRTSYDYDGLDRLTRIIQGGYVADFNMLGYSYNNRGMKATQSVRYGPVGSTISLSSFTPDNAGRLAAITHDVVGTAGDVTFGLDAYNPASQVTQRSTSNDAYVWTGAYNVSRDYAVNGLNQYTSAGPATFSYDANGNLTGDGANIYVYDVENRLVSASGASTASLRYDPLGRLYETGGATGLTRFLHDGDELVAEFDGNTNALLRRYLHGISVDDPVVAYEGSAFNQPRWLHTNHQGSIVAISDSSGAVTAKNTFDEWGIPGSSNASIAAGGRFSYTGQAWIPELGMYYYKARMYSPTLGRFMQTDLIGYKDQMNLYGYVGNDPINRGDPTGMYDCWKGSEAACDRVDEALEAGRKLLTEGSLNRKDRKNLENALTAAGTRNDGNGAVVVMGVRKGCEDMCAFVGDSQDRIIVVSPGVVNNNSDARFFGSILHEFGHIYDFEHLWGNNNPRNMQERYDTERRYTPLGIKIREALGYDGYRDRSPEMVGDRHGWNVAGCPAYERSNGRGTCPIVRW